MEHSKGIIRKVAGPLVIADGMRDANMFDVVRVSDKKLIGEIIEMHDDQGHLFRYMRKRQDLDQEKRLYPLVHQCLLS